MSLVASVHGDQAVELYEFALYRCLGCAELVGASTCGYVPLRELSLHALVGECRMPDELQVCPKCSHGSFEQLCHGRAFEPEEEELALLVWIDESRPGAEGGWFLLRRDALATSPGELDPDMKVAAAVLERRGLDSLGEHVDEEMLRERWGRALNVRNWLVERFGEIASSQDGLMVARAAPGLIVIAGRSGGDPHLLARRTAQRLAELEFSDDWVVTELTRGYELQGSYREWSGPYADRVGSEIGVLLAIDSVYPLECLRRDASRLGIAENAPPAPRHASLNAAPESDEGEVAIWLRSGSVPFAVRALAVATDAALIGLSPAAGIRSYLLRRQLICSEVEKAVQTIRSEFGDTPLALRHSNSLLLGEQGTGVEVMIENLLEKQGWNGGSSAFVEQLKKVIDPGQPINAATLSSSVQRCDCGDYWVVSHLRPFEHLSSTMKGIVRTEAPDLIGNPFSLLAAIECPHFVFFHNADYYAGATFDIDADPDRIRLEASAREILTASDELLAVRLVGTNIATALAHDYLRASLARELLGRFDTDVLAAIAISCDVVVVMKAQASTDEFELVITEAHIELDPQVLRTPLGYYCMLGGEDVTPHGQITLGWAADLA